MRAEARHQLRAAVPGFGGGAGGTVSEPTARRQPPRVAEQLVQGFARLRVVEEELGAGGAARRQRRRRQHARRRARPRSGCQWSPIPTHCTRPLTEPGSRHRCQLGVAAATGPNSPNSLKFGTVVEFRELRATKQRNSVHGHHAAGPAHQPAGTSHANQGPECSALSAALLLIASPQPPEERRVRARRPGW